MRAICESCAKPQPGDWRAGDLCIHCGQAVCAEVRCFWCARWTPAAKYCRKCGADVLEDPSLYAPARMLKDAGTDRFTIPKLLREFDADRIAFFRGIYQQQAAIAAAHVADLDYVETFLYQRVWAAELDDQFAAELPWPDGRAPRHIHFDSIDGRLRHIAEHSPIAITKQLATLALLHQGEWRLWDQVAALLHSQDERVREETALTLTHWRTGTAMWIPRELDRVFEELLSRSRFIEEARVRLAMRFPQKYEPPRDLLGSTNADIRFAAALCVPDEPALRSAVFENPDELARFAAFSRLASEGALDANLIARLDSLEAEHQVSVLDLLNRRKQPVPHLSGALLDLMSRTPDKKLINRAANALSRGITPETAIAISNLDTADKDLSPILFRCDLPGETLATIAQRLVDRGVFSASMYGLDEAAKRMPETFASGIYQQVTDPAMRTELIRFAEVQAGDCNLDFLAFCSFTETGEAQQAAWSGASRVRHRDDLRAAIPFEFEAANVKRIFGSMDRFLRLLTDLLRSKAWRDNVAIFDPLAGFLHYSNPNIFPLICESGAVDEYVGVLCELLLCDELRGNMQGSALYPLIGIASVCKRLRPRIQAFLQPLTSGSNIVAMAQYALERIEAAVTDHPADTQ